MPYQQVAKQLGDLVSARALERVIENAAQDRSLKAEHLTNPQLADILKRDVFRRLQLTVPASLAKRRIEEVLSGLASQTPAVSTTAVQPAPSQPPVGQTHTNQALSTPPITERYAADAQPLGITESPTDLSRQAAYGDFTPEQQQAHVSLLEESLKAYALYFDWPEVKRLRALGSTLRSELEMGKPLPSHLIREGNELLETLSSRLAEALVLQESDLAELRAGFSRVEGVGGPKVRRLSGLLDAITSAQKDSALMPSEVDRARNLTLDLRKLVASSVAGLAKDGAAPKASDPLLQEVRDMDRAHEQRALGDLSREFAPLLRSDSTLSVEMQATKERLDNGHLIGEERFISLRQALETAFSSYLASQNSELLELESRLRQLDPERAAVQQANISIVMARGLLESGSLATDELLLLSRSVPVLERAGESTEDALESQRELMELEQAARDLPMIEGLQSDLAHAAQALDRGEMADLSALRAVIEERKNTALQERQSYDDRSRQVLEEYGRYRHLAGETISHLGRLADTLRSHLKLGKLSESGRAHYLQILTEAEALLGEARAEFQVARDLTAQFGEDALTGLLDALGLDEEPEQEIIVLPPLPTGLWELRGGSVMRGVPDPQVWSLARLSAQLTELPPPIGDAEVRLDSMQGVWLLVAYMGGHRVAYGSTELEARQRLSQFPED